MRAVARLENLRVGNTSGLNPRYALASSADCYAVGSIVNVEPIKVDGVELNIALKDAHGPNEGQTSTIGWREIRRRTKRDRIFAEGNRPALSRTATTHGAAIDGASDSGELSNIIFGECPVDVPNVDRLIHFIQREALSDCHL